MRFAAFGAIAALTMLANPDIDRVRFSGATFEGGGPDEKDVGSILVTRDDLFLAARRSGKSEITREMLENAVEKLAQMSADSVFHSSIPPMAYRPNPNQKQRKNSVAKTGVRGYNAPGRSVKAKNSGKKRGSHNKAKSR